MKESTVIKDLFRQAEAQCPHYGDKTNRWIKRCCDECWDSLKVKFLELDNRKVDNDT